MLCKTIELKSVWAEGFSDEMNVTVSFRARIIGGEFKLRMAASNTYRIFLNDQFVAYGPLRSAHGYSNVAVYSCNMVSDAYLTVEVASYNIDTYYTVKEKPFFACEIVRNGNIIANTDNFAAYLVDDRVQRVAKYAFQRPFCESYVMNADRTAFYLGKDSFQRLNMIQVAGNKLLQNEILNPAFERIAVENVIESGEVSISKDFQIRCKSFLPDKRLCSSLLYEEWLHAGLCVTDHFTGRCRMSKNTNESTILR